MTTADTASVARAYFDAWTNAHGPESLRPLMATEFVFDGGAHQIEGREAFLAGGGWPPGATTRMLAEAYDGEHGFQLYSASHGDVRVKIAEHLTVAGRLIVSSEIVVDGATFLAFLAGAAPEATA